MTGVTYPCYIQRKDERGHWYWVYYAVNGEAIDRSSESYVKQTDCTHSINLVKGSASHPVHTA